MTLLAFLPQAIIDSILDEEMSPCVIKLWISGDRSMQHKILTGVTTIKLVDRREFTLSRFPKFIEELRSLRELTIDRAGHSILYNCNIPQHIQRLPPTLKKLIIRAKNSGYLIYHPTLTNASNLDYSTQYHTTNDLRHPEWTLAGAFPQLKTLELHFAEEWGCRALALLPQSLTSFTTSPPTEFIDKTFSSLLPRNLLTLKLAWQQTLPTFTSCFWTNLPPHLTKITSPAAPNMETESISALLPRSLTHIEGNFWSNSLDLTALPPNLNNLCHHWTVISDIDQSPPLAQIFSNLREISLVSLTPQALRLLPSSIHTIEAYSIMDGISTDEWPESLTKLTSGTPIKEHILAQLPSSGLTHLIIATKHDLDVSCITLLPRSLHHIAFECRYLNGFDANDIVYPPGLTFLSVSSRRDFMSLYDIHNLPASLTYLKLSIGISASQLKMLPPRLKHLETLTIAGDSDFNPSSEAERDAMRLNFANGAAQGIGETFDSNQLDRASIFALLPRTLAHLYIGYTEMDCDTLGWRMVPPLLETITCMLSEGLPVSFLDIMPKTLHSLHLFLNGVEDFHLQLLPRHLRQADLFCHNSPNLTMLALQYAPVACDITSDGTRAEVERFKQLRNEHADDENPSFFLELLAPTNKFLKTHFNCE